jgi:putative hydrolase of the HAD superfamily
MGPIRAVFLDRDGVICRRHDARSAERTRLVGKVLGQPDFHLNVMDEHRLFYRVYEDPSTPPIVTPEAETEFWCKWGKLLFEEQGMVEGAAAAAREICRLYPYYSMLDPWPETPGVLERLRNSGYRLGVISNTFPSLVASIEAMGLAHFFEAFIASALVGIEKPDPGIYRAALETLGVRASESVFVDDLVENADAAREMGFTSFRLDRGAGRADWPHWTIHSLTDLCEYLLEN